MFERFATGKRRNWKRRALLIGSLALARRVSSWRSSSAAWFHVTELTPPLLAVVFVPPSAPPRSSRPRKNPRPSRTRRCIVRSRTRCISRSEGEEPRRRPSRATSRPRTQPPSVGPPGIGPPGPPGPRPALQRRQLRRRAGAEAAQRRAARARRAALAGVMPHLPAGRHRRAQRARRQHLHGAHLRRPGGLGLVGDRARRHPRRRRRHRLDATRLALQAAADPGLLHHQLVYKYDKSARGASARRPAAAGRSRAWSAAPPRRRRGARRAGRTAPSASAW